MTSFTKTRGCLRPLVAVLFLLIQHPASYAQSSTGLVTGRVSDAAADSKPLEGVRVLISTPDGRDIVDTSTDGSGTYRILALSPGDYQIRFSRAPYGTLVVAGVTVENDRACLVNVAMQKAAANGTHGSDGG